MGAWRDQFTDQSMYTSQVSCGNSIDCQLYSTVPADELIYLLFCCYFASKDL